MGLRRLIGGLDRSGEMVGMMGSERKNDRKRQGMVAW